MHRTNYLMECNPRIGKDTQTAPLIPSIERTGLNVIWSKAPMPLIPILQKAMGENAETLIGQDLFNPQSKLQNPKSRIGNTQSRSGNGPDDRILRLGFASGHRS
jgi:hypothetical protein